MLLLSGCVSDGVGTDYAAIAQKVGPPKAGHSRIVVLQEKRTGLSAFCACEVKLDGELIGRVAIGTYVFVDRPAGRHQFVASEALFPGDTTYNFTTEPGRTYFFLIRASATRPSAG
ncbi:DUF2846 domain-containing protein [Bradyrhizobium jicamae]|uniref:DUF2846 domain-containing protein n=1 Tax=Bradyrhizobium jicamae TaxID=280332 RepID=UPI00289E434F|nr:DUF2846 domain-containing protein [Bradyrhizobium jicamae]